MMESKLQLLLKETKTSVNDLDKIVQDDFVQCPLDSSHRIPKESYANHMVNNILIIHNSGMFIIMIQNWK